MANFWHRAKEDDSDNLQGEYKPEQLKSELEATFENKFKSYREEQDAKLTPLMEMAASFKQSQEAASAARRQEANNRHAEDNAVDDDLWITSPGEANRRANLSIRQQTQAIAAITMRREILSDKEYYTGEIKEQVDQLIEQQPLEHRANASILENAYYTVLGRRTKEIEEGKLKKQASFTGFNGNGTGGPSGNSVDEKDKPLSDEEKYVAGKFGMTEAEMRKSLQELNYV